MVDVKVSNDEVHNRYVAKVDGSIAGSAYYDLSGALIVFTHTEVEPVWEGEGVGSALARGALDDVRADGTRLVVARCPFIASWIERHPEYRDLLD